MRPDSRFGAVPFTMIRRRGDDAPDWTPELLTAEYHIPGSNRVDVQVLGQGRLTLDVTLLLPSQADFAALMALLGTEATLHMAYGATAFPGDTEGQEFDALYKAYSTVLLTMPRPRIVGRRNGAVEIDVRFSRAVPA